MNVIKSTFIAGESSTIKVAKKELHKGLNDLLGQNISAVKNLNEDGILLAGIYKRFSLFKNVNFKNELEEIGSEGFIIRRTKIYHY